MRINRVVKLVWEWFVTDFTYLNSGFNGKFVRLLPEDFLYQLPPALAFQPAMGIKQLLYMAECSV